MSKATDNAHFAGLEQRRLKDKGLYLGTIDEWFGPSSIDAWRQDHGLAPVIPAVTLPDPPVLGDLPQPAASYTLPRETTAAMTAFYGSPSSSPDYLVWFSFPMETRLYDRGGGFLGDKVGADGLPDHRTHRLLAGRLQAALAEIYATLGRDEYIRQGWHVYGGSHNYRKKVGGSSLSTHAWALAVDMNPDENPYARTASTFSPASIDIMEKWGFLSGFRAWGKDAMHFQAAIPNLSSGSYYARNGFPKNIKIAA